MPVSLHCHHQNDSCITEIGSDESYFNVSLIVRGKVTKWVSTDHNPSEEKGEPKRYRTEVLLTSLTCLTARPNRLTLLLLLLLSDFKLLIAFIQCYSLVWSRLVALMLHNYVILNDWLYPFIACYCFHCPLARSGAGTDSAVSVVVAWLVPRVKLLPSVSAAFSVYTIHPHRQQFTVSLHSKPHR